MLRAASCPERQTGSDAEGAATAAPSIARQYKAFIRRGEAQLARSCEKGSEFALAA